MTNPQPLKANKEEVIELIAQGKTGKEIANKFGVDTSAVFHYKKAHLAEVEAKALEYLKDAASLSSFALGYASKLLAKKLERKELVETDELIKIIRELRATAETLIKRGDINITQNNIEHMTIEQMAGQLAKTHTREQLEEIAGRKPKEIGRNGT